MRNSTSLPRAAALSALMVCLLVLGPSAAQAAPKPTSISLVPTITSITAQAGQLLASGTVSAVIHGKTTTVPFSGVPVSLAAPGTIGADGCPILNLTLAPIDLN